MCSQAARKISLSTPARRQHPHRPAVTVSISDPNPSESSADCSATGRMDQDGRISPRSREESHPSRSLQNLLTLAQQITDAIRYLRPCQSISRMHPRNPRDSKATGPTRRPMVASIQNEDLSPGQSDEIDRSLRILSPPARRRLRKGAPR